MANSSHLQILSSTSGDRGSTLKQNSQSKNSSVPLSRSRQRWKLLSQAIRLKQFNLDDLAKTQTEVGEQKCPPDPLSAIESFGLMEFEPSDYAPWINCRWNQQFKQKPEQDFLIDIKLAPNQMQIKDLAGFDNSGNVRVWLSEEVLAYLVNGLLKEKLRGRVICELGAGMTALAGLVYAQLGLYRKLYLTDGNERCVANIQEIVQRNFNRESTVQNGNNIDSDSLGDPHQIYVQRLCWNDQDDDEYNKLHHQIETIICADCLFCSDAHRSLIETIDHLLVVKNSQINPNEPSAKKRSKIEEEQPFLSEQEGHVFILAPRRGDKLDRFIDRVVEDGRFLLMVYESYDSAICEVFDQARQRDPIRFDPDTSYPFLLVMKRRIGIHRIDTETVQ